MLDSFSIHWAPFAVDTFRQILDNSSTTDSRVLNLDTSRSVEIYVFLYIRSARKFSHFLWSLSIDSHFSLSQTPQTQPLHIPHLIFGPNQVFFLWYDLISLLYHAFHSFLPKFWVFENFLVFFKIDEVFAKFLGWVLLKWVLKHHALHYICIITMYHAF